MIVGRYLLFTTLALFGIRSLEGVGAAEPLRVYVGTYTGKESKGIYRFDYDPATGALSNRALAAESPNPSFLALHPSRRFLFAVSEISDFEGKKTGAVRAFRVDPDSGDLTPLNQRTSAGAGPCHLVVDKAGGHVLVANYGSGSAGVLPIGEDGNLGTPSSMVIHEGTVADPRRQGGPHAHSINLDAANRFAFVADLGLDKVFVYRYDPSAGSLASNDPPFAALPPRSGPRHFAFHPNGRNAYVINEINCTVTAFGYDPERGVLTTLQTVSTLPAGVAVTPGDSTAEVVVHPSGKFLYGSNRGHNSIAVFAIDPKSGTLTPSGHLSKRIKTPRNFAIDPDGRFLLVANQDGHDILACRIDQGTGRLTIVGEAIAVPSPVCVKFVATGH